MKASAFLVPFVLLSQAIATPTDDKLPVLSSEQSLQLADRSPEPLSSPDDLEPRIIPALVAVVIRQIAISVVKDLITAIGDLPQKEGNFTSRTGRQLSNQYPDKNIMIYHNQKSTVNFFNAEHEHYELDLLLGFTKGYEIYVFDYGTFKLAGDTGWRNWAFYGSFSNINPTSVTFFKKKAQATVVPPMTTVKTVITTAAPVKTTVPQTTPVIKTTSSVIKTTSTTIKTTTKTSALPTSTSARKSSSTSSVIQQQVTRITTSQQPTVTLSVSDSVTAAEQETTPAAQTPTNVPQGAGGAGGNGAAPTSTSRSGASRVIQQMITVCAVAAAVVCFTVG